MRNSAQFPSHENTVRVTRISLETLGRRIDQGVAGNLGAQLPDEVGRFLIQADATETFEWDEFVDRVVEAGDYSPEDECGDAVHLTRVVMDIVIDAVTAGAIEDLCDQIPSADDWKELFALVDQEEKPVDEDQRLQ